MSDLRPLLDDALSDEAAKLLRSATTDLPKHAEASRARVAAAMAASPKIEVASSAAKTVSGSSLSLALAGLVLVVGGASFVATMSNGPTSTTPATVVGAPHAVAQEVPSSATVEPPRTALEAPSPLPSLRVEDLPTATPAPAAPTAARTTPVDELAMIDAARAALTAGHPTLALQRVAEYRALGRARTYAVEADVIEIEALGASGRTAEARARATRFVEEHPRSPYEQRIQRFVKEVP